MVAYTYPLLGIFWSLLMFAGFALIVFLVIWCFVDDFRRADLSGPGKAGWAVVILFIPLFGALMYLIARPD